MILLLTAAVAAADTALPDAVGTVLQYRAFVAGAPVGEAEVEVSVEDGSYRVAGQATSNSFLSAFSPWRNDFTALGTVDGDGRETAEFAYLEHNGRNSRDVTVRDGIVRVYKNGKARSEQPSPSGHDVLSALFVAPRCDRDQVLHTGRHVYRLQRLASDDGWCRFQVSDDDGETFEVELQFGRRAGLVVPERITVRAWLTGWIELVPAQARPTASR
jgi:hypothetical protein